MENIKPLRFIEKNYYYFDKNSKIYDLGCGSWRNSIFLSEKWLKIVAIDNDEKILEKINHPNIVKINSDFKKFLEKNENLENIIASFILRFDEKNFEKNILQIQNSTKIGGKNIIIDFIDDWWKFVEKWKNITFYWLKENELKKFYENENWETLDYIEENEKTRVQDENWNFLFCKTAQIIAKKIS